MLITDVTTYDEVRSALGVSQDELTDETLALPFYAAALEAELEEIDEDLLADYIIVEAIPEGTRTTAEARFVKAMTLFAPYAVAVQLTSSLPLFAPKAISDGKATLTRHSESPHKLTIERCQREYERWRTRLAEKYEIYGGGTAATASLPSLLGISLPETDPVTDEG